MNNDKRELGGIYLVLDPAMPQNELLNKLEDALKSGIELVQIWDHWPKKFDFDVNPL